jgi:hypothetical protein
MKHPCLTKLNTHDNDYMDVPCDLEKLKILHMKRACILTDTIKHEQIHASFPLILILFVIISLPVVAQPDKIDSLLNELIYEDIESLAVSGKPIKYDFIYAAANFNSDAFYAGREISSNMYNISGQLFYYNSTGLFAGISGIWFDQMKPAYSSTTFSAGYSKAIDKRKLLYFRTSYSRFLYYKPDTITTYPYKNNISMGFSFRKKWIGARISSNVLFGEEYKINLSAGVVSRINILKFGDYNKLYIAPDLSFLFSKETISTIDNSQTSTDQTPELKDVYGLLNTQLNIPFGITLGNFDLEFNYAINFPLTQDVNTSYPIKAFYGFSIGYMVPIEKK